MKLLGLLSVSFVYGVPAAELKVGVASVDITPPKGYRMSGYFYERLSTGTHDPLHAKAIVFSQGGAAAAIVVCDMLGISPEVSSRARARASRKTGIPAASIAITATHSHTGPLYFGALRKHLHDRAALKNGRDPQEDVDYPALLESRIAEAIERAQAGLAPARLSAGTAAQKPQLSFNRRFHMKDGSVVFNPGQENPDIVRAAGPIDPDVGILLFSGANDKPFASLTVFAMHLDTLGGTLYSADYPFYLEEGLQKDLGPAFFSLFGTGACGDLNHIDVSIKGRRSTEEIGTLLSETVKRELHALERIEAPSLDARSEMVAVPLQQYGADEVSRAARDMDKVGTNELPFLRQVEACKIMDLELRQGPTVPLEVQAFRLSREVAIVTLPGEIFVELGLSIKSASPFKTTLVIELSNDDPDYIPTRKAFAEGSYETVNSRIRPGGGEMLVEAAVRLLKELAR